jgi:glyoxylate reductase
LIGGTHMKKKVILTRKYQSEAIRQLQDEFELIIVEDSGKSLPEVLNENPDTEALIPFLSDKIDISVIDMGPNLKIIANYAVGYNNVDVDYAIRKGIPVTNTPDILTDATADMAMALMLAVSRRIVEGDRYVRQGQFKGWGANLLLGKALNGANLGIIGMGRIGLATAIRAAGFGMKVLYFSRNRKPELEETYGIRYMTFMDVVRSADVLSIHIPSTTETHHLINSSVLNAMKRDAIFINVSRGDLVDENCLAEKLEKKELFGAGLDVYEFEPTVHETLLRLDNAVLAPHTGSATYRARLGMAQMTIDNVKAVLAGQPPINLVSEWKDAAQQ